MPKQYWLLKSEPNTFSIDDLAASPKKTTCWEGVRNYQARNLMREMKKGDDVIFYHSNAAPPAAVGTATIARESYPDHYQFDPDSKYYDAKSNPDEPRWEMVDVRFAKKFERAIPLPELREQKALAGMELLRKGSRLSVQPVTEREFRALVKLGGL